MTTRTRILLNLLLALMVGALVGYAIHLLNSVVDHMIEDRIATAKFFSKLIKDNWDTIKSSDDEKQALLDLLDPKFLSTDIGFLYVFSLTLLFAMGAAFVLGRLTEAFKLWRASKARNVAP